MQETPGQYTQRILGHVQGKDPLRVQRETPKKLAALIPGLSRKQLTRKPAPGKWSIAEILAHLADTGIVVAWRLRHILATTALPSSLTIRTSGRRLLIMSIVIARGRWNSSGW